jgi:hypothetical protein
MATSRSFRTKKCLRRRVGQLPFQYCKDDFLLGLQVLQLGHSIEIFLGGGGGGEEKNWGAF